MGECPGAYDHLTPLTLVSGHPAPATPIPSLPSPPAPALAQQIPQAAPPLSPRWTTCLFAPLPPRLRRRGPPGSSACRTHLLLLSRRLEEVPRRVGDVRVLLASARSWCFVRLASLNARVGWWRGHSWVPSRWAIPTHRGLRVTTIIISSAAGGPSAANIGYDRYMMRARVGRTNTVLDAMGMRRPVVGAKEVENTSLLRALSHREGNGNRLAVRLGTPHHGLPQRRYVRARGVVRTICASMWAGSPPRHRDAHGADATVLPAVSAPLPLYDSCASSVQRNSFPPLPLASYPCMRAPTCGLSTRINKT
ncbi:hypothetical protein C8J57DRAFT_1722210 [Mycena rebaudengoi]|nr:hypothetical protein C8J57DRAFT_1722210 [Mycena rebaudengoi]